MILAPATMNRTQIRVVGMVRAADPTPLTFPVAWRYLVVLQALGTRDYALKL